MRWAPEQGHVPRGFHGAYGGQNEVELVLVFAEPGDPHAGEAHSGLDSAFKYAGFAFKSGKDHFHRNVRLILDMCWPGEPLETQLRRTWLTESVLCSAEQEGGTVPRISTLACGEIYLKKQLALFPTALVVALGKKAQARLRGIGVRDFLPAFAAAPPGCNFKGATESWSKIAQVVSSRRLTASCGESIRTG